MKKLIRRRSALDYIFRKAHDKKKAEKKVEPISGRINEHIIRCVVYKNTTNDLQHWIYDELTTWFDYINRIELKTKSGKFTEKSLDDILFGEFGDAVTDAEFNLALFRANVAKNGADYPDFQVTVQLAKDLRSVYDEIRTTFIPIFTKKNNYSRTDIYNMLCKILK